jgi:arabinofuranosyltransferase
MAYVSSLIHVGPIVLLWGLLLAILTGLARRGALHRRLAIVLAGGGLVAALAWSWHLRSLFDDAYISLRYAANLAHGNGLVFNVGERVEGFTNLLWTVALAGLIRLGADGPHAAVVGCLTAFAAELILLVRLSRMLREDRSISSIPFAAIVLGASYTFASYGTTGMETMASTLLMTLALERALAGRPALSGLSAALSIMSHPDSALLAGALGGAMLLSADEDLQARIRRAVTYGVVLVVLSVSVVIWRWHYYGDVVPNTYYAKSADQSYFGQGLIYVTASALSTGLWAFLLLAIVAAARRPRHLLTLFTLAAVPLVLFYVARIGGDFMLGRLLVPLLPPVALLAELGANDLLADRMIRLQSAGVLALLACAAAPAHLLGPREERWNIADERTWYPIVECWPRVIIESEPADRSAVLQDLIRRGLRPLVAEMNVGQESYETELPMIDLFGLTDRTIAHQPLQRRGRPGHEKVASVEYLRSRGVLLSAMPLYPERYAGKTRVRVHNRQFFLSRYDPELVRAFNDMPGALVPKLPAMIDDYLRQARAVRPPTLAEDVTFFDTFYFSCNNDPGRKAALKALIAPP